MASPGTVPSEMLITFAPGVSEAAAKAIVSGVDVEMIGPPLVGGRVFHVRVRDPRQFSTIAERLRTTSGVLATEPVQVVGVPKPAR